MKTKQNTPAKSQRRSSRKKKEVWYVDATTSTEESTKLAPPCKDASTITTFNLPDKSTLLTAPANQPMASSSSSSTPPIYQGDVRDYVSLTNRTLNQLKKVQIVKPGEGVKLRSYIGRRNALRLLTDAEYLKLAICANIDESKWDTTYIYTKQSQ